MSYAQPALLSLLITSLLIAPSDAPVLTTQAPSLR